MKIWAAEIIELQKLSESLKGRFPELDREVEQLIRTEDANVVMLYSRRCLEVIITDLCESELKRPRKTEPLKGIIDKLQKEQIVPPNIITSMDHLNSLSTFGAHPKDFDQEQVKPVINNLTTIIRWYHKHKDNSVESKAKAADEKAPDGNLLNQVSEQGKNEPQKKSDHLFRWKMPRGAILPGVILVVAIIIYPKLFKRNSLEKLRISGERISVAVMPFRNMTNDTLWNIWQDGIQFNLITSLSNSPELKVQESQSTYNLIQSKGFTNYASITPSVARTISQDLHANVFVYGSINQAGGNIRISAQLIDSKTQDIFKSFQIDGEFSKILAITDSLSSVIKSYLIISSLKKELTTDVGSDMTTSVEAFRSFILGYKAFINYDHQSAVKWFLQAIKMDSSYYPSYVWLSISYANQGQYDKAEEWARIVYDKRDLLSFEMKIWVNWLSAKYIEKSIVEEIKYGKQLEELNDQVPITHWLVGLPYYYLKQYNNAIPELEATIRIYKSWNSKPMNGSFYETLISCYHETGRYKEEKELLKRAIADFPDDPSIIRRQIIYSFNMNDTVTGNQYISKAVSLSKSLSKSDAEIAYGLADIYEATGKLDKAESYYRKALSLQPENVRMLNNLAFFLIDKDINVTEGMELIAKAYKLNPAKTWYMKDTKAWGLHKLGRNEEALKILEKCWDMRPDFNYLLYSHLEEVKKAVANQKY